MTPAAEYADFARAHLPEPLATRWISLVRPAIRFPDDMPVGERPALRMGGVPLLPQDVEWPRYEGFGLMDFIAEMDCAALAAAGDTGLRLPASGHLLFFSLSIHSEHADHEDFVPIDRGDRAVVLHVPADTVRLPGTPPPGFDLYPDSQHPARPAGSPPPADGELTARLFGAAAEEAMERHSRAARGGRPVLDDIVFPLWQEEFENGIRELRRGYRQAGGWPDSVQQPVELAAARHRFGQHQPFPPAEPPVLDEAEQWRLLFQTGDERGDGCTILYWLIRQDDLDAGRFDRVWFTEQR